MKNVILTADDFGRGYERNRAIIESFQKELITSAGLMVNNTYTSDAIELAKKNKILDRIHLHFNFSTSLVSEVNDNYGLNESFSKDDLFCENGKLRVNHGKFQNISSLFKCRIVYKELKAQYKKFIKETNGEANYSHVDFHLFFNLSWPVALALNAFTWKYKIKTVRYYGIHHRGRRNKIANILSWNPFVKNIPSTNIDYFLYNSELFKKFETIELYSHPNYKDGILLDDSPSYISIRHERQPMSSHMAQLKAKISFNTLSWKEI